MKRSGQIFEKQRKGLNLWLAGWLVARSGHPRTDDFQCYRSTTFSSIMTYFWCNNRRLTYIHVQRLILSDISISTHVYTYIDIYIYMYVTDRNLLAIISPISQMKTVYIPYIYIYILTYRYRQESGLLIENYIIQCFPFSTDYAPFLYVRYILTYIHSIAEQRRLGSKNRVSRS